MSNSIIDFNRFLSRIFLTFQRVFFSYNLIYYNHKTMPQKIYDLIIIGAGAAGMFTAIHAPKDASKLILEKTKKLGTKVLMSGGERCNVSNIDIEPERDYF